MHAAVKQDAKQIAVNAGKVNLHVQACVNVQCENNDCWMEDKDNVFEEKADDD